METKKWYQSKTVLIGLAEALIGVNMCVTQYLLAGDFSPVGVTLLLDGLLKVGLRTISSLPIE